MIRKLIRKASQASSKARLVFPEGDHIKIIKAAQMCVEEGIAEPILIGEPEKIETIAKEADFSLQGITIINPTTSSHFETYVDSYYQIRQRKGVTLTEAQRQVRSRCHGPSPCKEMCTDDWSFSIVFFFKL